MVLFLISGPPVRRNDWRGWPILRPHQVWITPWLKLIFCESVYHANSIQLFYFRVHIMALCLLLAVICSMAKAWFLGAWSSTFRGENTKISCLRHDASAMPWSEACSQYGHKCSRDLDTYTLQLATRSTDNESSENHCVYHECRLGRPPDDSAIEHLQVHTLDWMYTSLKR